MFDDLHGQNHIERAFACLDQLFDRRGLIADIQTDLRSMGAGGADIFRRGVQRGHLKPHAPHRLCQQATAAPDIDQRQTGKRRAGIGVEAVMLRHAVAHKAQTGRIEPVQRRTRSLRVPPFRSLSGKTCHIGGVNTGPLGTF